MAGEAALWRAWASRCWGEAALCTTDGQELQVIYTGRRRGAPGPDFQGALVVRGPAGRVECGDVEVHPCASGWQAHGHGGNPAYGNVILHVVLVDDSVEPVRRADGAPVPTLALAPYLLPGALDALLGTADDQEITSGAGACRVAPALSRTAVVQVIEEAGRARMAAKAAAYEGDLIAFPGEADQVLFRGLLDAAGYSRNRRPCGLIGERVAVRTLQALCAARPPAEGQALSQAVLLGMAGLLQPDDSAGQCLWEESQPLWLGTPLHRQDWQIGSVRPANRPEARLRGLGIIVARSAPAGLAASLLAPLGQPLSARKAAAALLAALRVRGGPGSLAVVGEARATEMLVNVVLPFALAWADLHRDAGLAAAVDGVLTVLTGSGLNETLATMAEIVGPAGLHVERLDALQQQGLLYLYAHHCALHDCAACPLARQPSS